MSVSISKSTLKFLKDLAQNNNRPWFNDHKDRYLAAHENMIEFAEALIDKMSHHDNLVPMTGKKSLMRIYRDVRFSKDKSPYKKNFGGGLKESYQMASRRLLLSHRARSIFRWWRILGAKSCGLKKNTS